MTTAIEPTGLAKLEALEQKARDGFMSAAEALERIQNERLWQYAAATWADYVKARWGKAKGWANTKIIDVKVVNLLPENRSKIPQLTTQAHAHALLGAPPEERAEILETVAKESPKVTAKAIKAEVARREEAREKVEEPKKPKGQNEPELTDRVNRALAVAPEFKVVSRKITSLLAEIESLATGPGGAYLMREFQAVQGFANNIKRILKFQAPFADCVVCDQTGKVDRKTCPQCRGCGYLPKLIFNACGEDKRAKSIVVPFKFVEGSTVQAFVDEANEDE